MADEEESTPLTGHLWTIVPQLLGPRRPPDLDKAARWSTKLRDPTTGELELRGLFDPRVSDTVVIIIHGLGGSAESPYMHRAVAAASDRGWASLRLNLRGAERSGQDYYHAGLTDDVRAALASPQLAPYGRRFLFGYSIGGHVAMHLSLDPPPGLAGVAAMSSPLDLERSVRELDQPRAFLYRRHVLSGAKDIYCRPGARHPLPTPAELVRKATSWREFDRLVIAPRWGFDSPEHYYAEVSIGRHLGRLEVPTLLVHSLTDPMVPPWTWQGSLEHANDRLVVRTAERGGHVAFPRLTNLGVASEEPPRLRYSVERQAMAWLDTLR